MIDFIKFNKKINCLFGRNESSIILPYDGIYKLIIFARDAENVVRNCQLKMNGQFPRGHVKNPARAKHALNFQNIVWRQSTWLTIHGTENWLQIEKLHQLDMYQWPGHWLRADNEKLSCHQELFRCNNKRLCFVQYLVSIWHWLRLVTFHTTPRRRNWPCRKNNRNAKYLITDNTW